METRFVATLLLAASCSTAAREPAPVEEADAFVTVRSEKLRNHTPDATEQELATATGDNREFGFDLYHRLRTRTTGNLFLSPYSISVALAMTWAGAAGATATDMASALRFTLPEGRLHNAFNALDLALAGRGQGASGVGGVPFKLVVANAIWGRQGYSFQPAFLDTLAVNYGAGLRLLDFAAATEASRAAINGWVSKQTEGRIPELLPQGVVKESTRLVLTNAVYFNAAWLTRFPPEASAPGPFHLADGTTASVKLMRVSGSFAMAEGQGWRAVELPYDGRELSMVVIVPEAGSFDSVEAQLDDEFFRGVVAGLAPSYTALTLPAWKNDSKFSLKEQLAALGMEVAFSDAADFSRINGGSEGLAISDVIHQANVVVTEGGTVASAATGVVVGPTSMPEPMTVDRPFIYAIRDLATGTVVFLGRVVDPRAESTSL